MDTLGVKRLLAAIIEQAVQDRRLAVTRGLIDCDSQKKNKELAGKDADIVSSLDYFFHKGGIELIDTVAGFDLPIDKIKRRSGERFER